MKIARRGAAAPLLVILGHFMRNLGGFRTKIVFFFKIFRFCHVLSKSVAMFNCEC